MGLERSKLVTGHILPVSVSSFKLLLSTGHVRAADIASRLVTWLHHLT